MMKRIFLLILSTCFFVSAFAQDKPNIILIMADDMGYGDVGFNGNTIIKTPHMDALAESGLKLTNFYSGGPVCSPTRGTCLTGRHYHRYGIFSANIGHLPKQEVTIQGLLKENGYKTGHFGKWHIGTLDSNYSTKGDSRKPAENFAPPWERDYDVSFVTESSVSTWDPLSTSVPYYFNGEITTENLSGDDSRVIMDRVVPFIESAVNEEKPFLSVIWFHTPHEPVVAGPEYKAMYSSYSEGKQHYYGCITAMDDQIGRLYNKLQDLNIDDNTIIFFCSDNGPEGKEESDDRPGSTGGLRGRKRSLYCGGTGVPAFIVWPGKTDTPSTSNYVSGTLDYLPTILDALDIEMPDNRPIDGISLLPMLNGTETERPRPLPFMTNRGKAAWIDGDLKFITNNKGIVSEVYNLRTDRYETTNLRSQYPEKIEKINKHIHAWNFSCKKSHAGGDYEGDYTPVDTWDGLSVSENIAELTIGEAFSFGIGDEFHSLIDSSSISQYIKRITVIDKHFSDNSDTVSYDLKREMYRADYDANQGDNNTNVIDSITVSYTDLNSFVFDFYSDLNYHTLLNNWNRADSFHYDTIFQSSYLICDSITNGFNCKTDENGIDPAFYQYEYSQGLGLTYSKTQNTNEAETEITNILFYYKKGEISCGTPDTTTIDTSSQTSLPSYLENIGYNISIYPNPVNEYLIIDGMEMPGYYSIFDLNGKIIDNGTILDSNTQINVDYLAKGLYIIHVVNDKSVLLQKKILIKN